MTDDEYKASWQPGTAIQIESKFADKAKTWCRRNTERKEWTMDAFTTQTEHTMRFSTPELASMFAEQSGVV